MQVILCVDDQPKRYEALVAICHMDHGIRVVVTDNADAIRQFFEFPVQGDEVIGVCLDHDMPQLSAFYVVEEFLGPRNIPVVVTSNNYSGANKLAAALNDFEVPCRIEPGARDREFIMNYFGIIDGPNYWKDLEEG